MSLLARIKHFSNRFLQYFSRNSDLHKKDDTPHLEEGYATISEESISAKDVAMRLGHIIFSKENNSKIAIASALVVLNTSANFCTYYILGETIKTLTKASNGDNEKNTALMISFLVLSYSLAQMIPNLRDQIMSQVTMQNVNKVLELSVDHLLHKSFDYHRKTDSSAHITLLQKGFSIPMVATPLLTQFAPILFEIISASFILSYLYGPEISISLAMFLSVFTFYSVCTVSPIIQARKESLVIGNATWEELDGAIRRYKTIHDYSHVDYAMHKIKQMLLKNTASQNKCAQLPLQLNMGHMLLSRVYMLVVALYIGQGIKSGSHTVESFVVLVGYLNQLCMSLPAFGGAINELCASYPDLQFIFKELAKGHEIQDMPNSLVFHTQERGGYVQFDHVHFAGLTDVSFDIPSGQTVAFVSESGGGKTTILNLLSRYYYPTYGRIIIDGQDIASVTAHSLRQHINIFGQNPHLFKGTIRQNVADGAQNPDIVTDEMIEIVAKEVGLFDFIKDLGKKSLAEKEEQDNPELYFKEGLNVDVGGSGQGLSGGEQQKIAVLRGMMKKSHIRLLDEVTASCDAASSAQILRGLRQTSKNITTIMVTHKLVEAKDADQIFVLEKGTITARGKHASLLQSNSFYRTLWEKNTDTDTPSLSLSSKFTESSF